MARGQLLLLTLIFFIVGIAIIVAVSTMGQSMSAANLDLLINDAFSMASRAQAFYNKPRSISGGGYSFKQIQLSDIAFGVPSDAIVFKNENGHYSIKEKSEKSVTITAEGLSDGNGDGTKNKINLYVWSDSLHVDIVSR